MNVLQGIKKIKALCKEKLVDYNFSYLKTEYIAYGHTNKIKKEIQVFIFRNEEATLAFKAESLEEIISEVETTINNINNGK